MKDNIGFTDSARLLWLISHGEKKIANEWAIQLATKLCRQEPLSHAEAVTLASALYACVRNDGAAQFFNKGKEPHGRNRLHDDHELYIRVNAHRERGKTRDDAIKLAGDELNYADDFKDEWESTAIARYDSVRKSFKKFYDELQRRKEMGNFLGGVYPPKWMIYNTV